MAAISYHSTIRDVQAQPLAASGPFASRDWFERLETIQPQPVYAVAEDASGAVVLPLRRKGRRLESLLDERGFTWHPLATPYGSLDSLLIALAQALAQRTSHIVLDRVPDEDGIARQLQRAFERAGWLVVREPCETRPISDAGERDGSCPEGRPDETRPPYRLECRRKRDPRNWPAIAGARLRTLVSGGARG